MKTTEWKTKDGKIVKIKDLETSHLINIIRFLTRCASAQLGQEINAVYSCLSMLNGDMAQFLCEQNIDRLEQTTTEEFLERTLPQWNNLMKEAEKRKLKSSVKG